MTSESKAASLLALRPVAGIPAVPEGVAKVAIAEGDEVALIVELVVLALPPGAVDVGSGVGVAVPALEPVALEVDDAEALALGVVELVGPVMAIPAPLQYACTF